MTATAVVCFGELLTRLSPPGRELLLQSPRLEVAFGGAEANVAVGLAQLGREARMASIVPDNPLGRAALRELRRWGVDVDSVRFGEGRMGLYFVMPGGGPRSAEVLYDRTGSAFGIADPRFVDWERALAGAAWLHLTGVTPATGAAGAAAALRAAEVAHDLGVKVSFDGNYRGRLWAERAGEAPTILRELLSYADLAVVTDRDVGMVLARDFGPGDELARRGRAAAAAFDAFPRLTTIASLLRTAHGADHHDLSAVLFTREASVVAERLEVRDIVDRIGAGDAFAAGLLHGLIGGLEPVEVLACGLRCAAHKHGVPGDFGLATAADLAAFDEAWTDVRR